MKRNKEILLCLFIFLNINISYAQPAQQGAVQSYSLPSPSVGAMNQYIETPVNLSTGVPAIEVPVYVASADNIEVPVSLSYHASGIKVNQNSTEVGLGWCLNAGGAITREVRGQPDPAYVDYYDAVGKYWSNAYLNPNNSDCDYEVLYTLDAGTVDGQPDIYTFNVNGDHFQFFRVPAGNGQMQFYTMPERNVIIQQNGNNWIVTLENGTKYYFGNHRETGEGYTLEIYELSEKTVQSFITESSKSLPDKKEEGKNWEKKDWAKTPVDTLYTGVLSLALNYRSNKNLENQLNEIKKVLEKQNVYYAFYYNSDEEVKDYIEDTQLFILDVQRRKLYVMESNI